MTQDYCSWAVVHVKQFFLLIEECLSQPLFQYIHKHIPGILLIYAFSFSIPWLLDLWIVAIWICTLVQSIYCLLENSVSAPPSPHAPGLCHLIGVITVSSKAFWSFCQASCFLMMETMVRHGLPQRGFGCKVSSLIRNNTVWNTMMMDKASVSPQMVVLADALHAGEANP